jgi:thiol-disulfide isomerase/thioredoxin
MNKSILQFTMKNLFLVISIFFIPVILDAQEKQFLPGRMKECFSRADSLKRSDSALNLEHNAYDDFICKCIEGCCMNDFRFRTMKDDSLSFYSIHKPVVLFLFAYFCKPCMAEIPALNYLAKKYAGDIVFLGITLDTKKVLATYASRYDHRIILSPSQTDFIFQSLFCTLFSINRQALPIPTVYFIDRDKKIVSIHVGAIEEFSKKQYGMTGPEVREILKAQADSENIAALEPGIKMILKNK